MELNLEPIDYEALRESHILEWLGIDEDDLIVQLLRAREYSSEEVVGDLRKKVVDKLESMIKRISELDIKWFPHMLL